MLVVSQFQFGSLLALEDNRRYDCAGLLIGRFGMPFPKTIFTPTLSYHSRLMSYILHRPKKQLSQMKLKQLSSGAHEKKD